jgi:hypothetical protein
MTDWNVKPEDLVASGVWSASESAKRGRVLAVLKFRAGTCPTSWSCCRLARCGRGTGGGQQRGGKLTRIGAEPVIIGMGFASCLSESSRGQAGD